MYILTFPYVIYVERGMLVYIHYECKDMAMNSLSVNSAVKNLQRKIRMIISKDVFISCLVEKVFNSLFYWSMYI